jgi:hypothetical protein
VSTFTVGAGVAGLAAVSVQLTLAGWTLVEEATGSTSGIVPAAGFALDATSTASVFVVVVGLAGGGVPDPAGTDSVQSTSTCCPPSPAVITACGYAITKYEDPAASDWVATCVALDPSVVAAVFDPYSFPTVGVQVTLPERPTLEIAPVEHELETRSCTAEESTCLAPTDPLMIFRAPTALDFSFQLPTLPFWSWALPTLFLGRLTAA